MEDELGAISLTWNTALKVAWGRGAWRVLIKASCATGHEETK